MSRNSSGTYSLPVGNPVVSGEIISSSWANNTMNDIATALTDSLSRSGKGGMTAALKLFDGTAGSPGLTFDTETTTGFYRAGSNDVRFSIAGVELMKMLASGVTLSGKTSDANSVSQTFDKIRGTSIVQADDVLGSVIWRGYDGSSYVPAASIVGSVNGTPGSSDMPGGLGFYTTADGASSSTRRLFIDNAGDLTLDHINSNTSGQTANVYVDGNGKLYKGQQAVPSTKSWTYFTASGTYTVPAGVTSIRAYAGGKGGNGATVTGNSGGGGGGGFAFGDIAVTAGQTVTVSISSGIATLSIGGTTYLTANPGSNGSGGTGGSGGTATVDVSVTNGGAYSGGAGGTATGGGFAAGGGGSCGSPLGNGYAGGSATANYNGSGAGIGGAGSESAGGGGAGGSGSISGAGGGAGGPSIGSEASGSSGGPSRAWNARFTDPLLAGAVAPGGVYTGTTGASAGPGGGGGWGSTYGGAGGDFGGGGAAGAGYCGKGGLMGGGAGNRTNSAGYNGCPGGLGGGGGGGSVGGGAGGGAFVFIYA